MRFTIHDLLWLTLLAAVLIAWWVDRKGPADRNSQPTTRMYPLVGPGRIVIQECQAKIEIDKPPK